MMSEETNETCPQCGTPRPSRLGYCRECEYVFAERAGPKEKIVSRYWFSTWLFYLLLYFTVEYNRIHFATSILITIGVFYVSKDIYPEWTIETMISTIFWLIGMIPIPLVIFLFILSFTCSRKVIRVSDVRTETIVETNRGRTTSREVQIIETDMGQIEGKVGQFDQLKPGKSYRCWYGEKFSNNQPFVCEPFEPVYVEP